ncbi:MAG: hypothetical protein M3N93_13750 [Acidobacteriota bacterium]|nr:hypothetical protein [Acidobacteriota bacterium]
MPGNLLILALLAGFCFVHRCYSFKFRAQLLDGYRLLLYCSLAGAAALLISRSLVLLLKLFPVFWQVRPLWDRFAAVPWLGTFCLCIPVALVCAEAWNLFVDPEDCRQKEVIANGDSLMQLMQRAANEERMLSITFDSRKWYAGYLVEAPNLKPSERYFKLLPILSGYRDKDTLVARRTLSYVNIDRIPGINPADFAITLPIASVRTANLFDPAVYEDHFAAIDAAPPASGGEFTVGHAAATSDPLRISTGSDAECQAAAERPGA